MTNRARRWGVAAMTVYLGLGGLILVAEGGNPEWFVHFGRDPGLSETLPLARAVFGEDVRTPYVDGHDGQRFWVQARDPLLRDPHEVAQFVDRPVYRAQRVLYPLLAAPSGLAGDHALILGMVAVNIVAVGAGTWAAARLAARRAGHRWSPLAYALSPAVFLAFTLVTADALAVALVLVALDAVDRERLGLAGVALAAAALAKEPMILVALAIAVRALVADRRAWRAAATLAVPAAVAVLAWGLYVRLRLGFGPTGIREFTFPLAGYVEAWRRQWVPFGDWAQVGVAVVLVALGGLAVLLFWRRRSLLMWAAVPFALLIPFFTAPVLVLSTNTPRVVGPLLTLVLLEVASGRGRGADPAEAAGAAARPQPVAALPGGATP